METTGAQLKAVLFVNLQLEALLLSKPCDACGHMIGGGYKRCPKCNIYLCLMYQLDLSEIQNDFPAKCPMCGGEIE